MSDFIPVAIARLLLFKEIYLSMLHSTAEVEDGVWGELPMQGVTFSPVARMTAGHRLAGAQNDGRN